MVLHACENGLEQLRADAIARKTRLAVSADTYRFICMDGSPYLLERVGETYPSNHNIAHVNLVHRAASSKFHPVSP